MKERIPPSQPAQPSPARLRTFVILALAVAFVPGTASANVGTPLLWAASLHLYIGNAVLGVLEGFLLHKIFKARLGRSIGFMVLANYLSGFIGLRLLDDERLMRSLFPDVSIVNLPLTFGIVALLAFALTLIVEFPLIWLSLRGAPRAFVRALGADLVIHAVTYPLLFVIFWAFSETTLLTRVSVVDAASLVPPEVHELYYLSPDGKRIMKTRLGSARQEVVSEVSAPGDNDRLFARRDAQGRIDLALHMERDDNPQPKTDDIILRDFAGQASLDFNIAQGFTDKAAGSWHNDGPAAMLAKTSDWKYETGFWHAEGLKGENVKDGTRLRFSLETIFFQWEVRNATHLQGDVVVFQLGKDQICIMHPTTRRIALLARGKGPVVALPKP